MFVPLRNEWYHPPWYGDASLLSLYSNVLLADLDPLVLESLMRVRQTNIDYLTGIKTAVVKRQPGANIMD